MNESCLPPLQKGMYEKERRAKLKGRDTKGGGEKKATRAERGEGRRDGEEPFCED